MSSLGRNTDATYFKAAIKSAFEEQLSRLRSEHERIVNELIQEFNTVTEHTNAASFSVPSTELSSPKESGIVNGVGCNAPSVSIRSSELESASPKVESLSFFRRGRLKVAATFDLFPTLHVLARTTSSELCGKKCVLSKSSLYTFVRGESFETFTLATIVLSAFVSCMESQYSGYSIAYSLRAHGYNGPAESKWPGAADLFTSTEKFFLILFSLELALRLVVYNFRFFCKLLNWVDFIVVVFGYVSWLGSDMFNPKLLRLLRVIRLAGLLRGFFKYEFFDAVHLLLGSMRASMSTLFWSLCVVVLIQFIAALCVTQGLNIWLLEAPENNGSREVFKYFGTFTRSVMTMFEILIGNWALPRRVLAENVGEWCGYLILFYRCVCGFSVINVISAVFIQQTMKIMSQDTDIMLMERARAEKRFKVKPQALFCAMDVDDDGIITKEELHKEMTDPDVYLKCFQLGLDVHDLEDMFSLFCGRDDGMRVSDFIDAAHAIRKQSSTLDIGRLLMHSRQVQRQLYALRDEIGTILGSISRSPTSLPYRAGIKESI